jgi:hypothetical protein
VELDAQAPALAAGDVDRVALATADLVEHGLAGEAEPTGTLRGRLVAVLREMEVISAVTGLRVPDAVVVPSRLARRWSPGAVASRRWSAPCGRGTARCRSPIRACVRPCSSVTARAGANRKRCAARRMAATPMHGWNSVDGATQPPARAADGEAVQRGRATYGAGRCG